MKNLLNMTLIIMAIVFTRLPLFASGGGSPGGGDFVNDSDLLDFHVNQGTATVSPNALYGYEATESFLKNVENLVPGFAVALRACSNSKPWVLSPVPLRKGTVSAATEVNEERRSRLADQTSYEIRIDQKFLEKLQNKNDKKIERNVGGAWFHEMVRCIGMERGQNDDRKIQKLTYELATSKNEVAILELINQLGFGHRGLVVKSEYDKLQAKWAEIETKQSILNKAQLKCMKLDEKVDGMLLLKHKEAFDQLMEAMDEHRELTKEIQHAERERILLGGTFNPFDYGSRCRSAFDKIMDALSKMDLKNMK